MNTKLGSRIILLLGSNSEPKKNISCAVEQLRILFDPIHLSNPEYTQAIGGYPDGTLFLNQLAVAYTSKPKEEVKILLKELEHALGRSAEDKFKGIVSIDIDLLQWNDEILKPDDMKRDYVISGLQSINNL